MLTQRQRIASVASSIRQVATAALRSSRSNGFGNMPHHAVGWPELLPTRISRHHQHRRTGCSSLTPAGRHPIEQRQVEIEQDAVGTVGGDGGQCRRPLPTLTVV